MKTLSEKMSFIALVVAAVVVVSLGVLAIASGQQTAGSKWTYMKTIKSALPYREFKAGKNQTDFDAALTTLKMVKKGDYHLRFLCTGQSEAQAQEGYDPTDPNHHKFCLKTDKVTKSDVASNAAADGSAANDPNAVYHLYSNTSETDFDPVLNLFK